MARRDPDALLTALKAREESACRGRLKIFFGASAGVGKTYTMLESARAARSAGVDVVVGYVEPHGRIETERLLLGLEQLPFLEIRYRGIIRREFDLDAALKRRPSVLLVDELAHSNIAEGEPKPRHAKRWQDIEELLGAGICVWTTLNVQHLESLNDVVAGITGVRQRETVPDRVFDQADEVELIDLPPGDLLARLRAGKVYTTEQAATATERFFSEPNLLALRELALRRTADRVDAAARTYSDQGRSSKPWLARDRFLIAVALDDQAEQLIRVGKRFADALDAEWIVVSVETPAMLKLDEAMRNRRIDILRLAESLGAQTVTLDGPSAADAVTEYARVRNITRIVVGEPRRFGWKSMLRPSTAAKLVGARGGFDVSVIARRDPPLGGNPSRARSSGPREVHWGRIWTAVAISAACTGLAAVMYPYFALTNLVMIYLLGATIAALRLGQGPAILAAIVNVVAFDFFFVPPRYSFAVSDFQYLVTFAVMLVVALTIATLVANVRAQTRVAGARERRTSLLYAMSRELAATRGVENLARVAIKHVAETFAARAVVLVPEPGGRLRHPARPPGPEALKGSDLSVAQWVFDHSAPAGLGTDTLPAAPAQYLPLVGSQSTWGVLAVEPTQRRRLLLPEQRHLLETFAGQIALALERAELANEAERARVNAETESLRNTLENKANEMSEIISTAQELVRLESGQVAPRRDWLMLQGLVNSALARLGGRLAGYPVEIRLPEDLPAVHADGALMLQVLVNLLENVAKHTPPGTRIAIFGNVENEFIRVLVDDDGPSFPPGDPEQLFAKFHRGRDESNVGGAGLGLSICRAIMNAHGGSIHALQRPGGGARFSLTIPIS
ncbi:MAG: two-component system, OmpR family, sensor histidine kinase KdpD [Gammaproteobacteria bacterium]|nr:two-component system, OmpR family, sensor histidine kinase KdpD [Gammaproteobacteria bacterium]